MSIIDYMKEQKVSKTYAKDVQEAVNIYLEQKNAIKDIKDKKGMKEIIKYFEREKDAALKAIMNSGKARDYEKGKYELADNFLSFVNRLTSGS